MRIAAINQFYWPDLAATSQLAQTAGAFPTWVITGGTAKADALNAAKVDFIELGMGLNDHDFILAAARNLARSWAYSGGHDLHGSCHGGRAQAVARSNRS